MGHFDVGPMPATTCNIRSLTGTHSPTRERPVFVPALFSGTLHCAQSIAADALRTIVQSRSIDVRPAFPNPFPLDVGSAPRDSSIH
jgi:hypothetical protein